MIAYIKEYLRQRRLRKRIKAAEKSADALARFMVGALTPEARLELARKRYEAATAKGLVRKTTPTESKAAVDSLVRSGETLDEARRIVYGTTRGGRA